MTSIAIILVHYHTAGLLAGAVDALLADLSGSGLSAELIVVDNGSREADRSWLQSLPVRWIDAGGNRGYAGGLNLGVRQTAADMLFFMNCDVEVTPGCIGALVRMLNAGAAAAGPRFYWDRNKTVLLPPTEEQHLTAEMWRRLAGCGESWITRARRHWRRHARRHWLAQQPLASPSLSGALLGVTRDAWNRIGQFDEGFKLYYEETDWLIRLERHGLQPYHVPEAEAIHFYNQSAAGEPEAAAWYAESTKRFQGRYYGIAATNFLNWLPQGGSTTCAGASRLAGGLSEINAGVTRAISPACRWIEISPLMSGFPAAAAQVGPGNRWQLPADLWEHMAPGRYSLRALNDEETELHHFVFDVTVDARGMVHGGRGHA